MGRHFLSNKKEPKMEFTHTQLYEVRVSQKYKKNHPLSPHSIQLPQPHNLTLEDICLQPFLQKLLHTTGGHYIK